MADERVFEERIRDRRERPGDLLKLTKKWQNYVTVLENDAKAMREKLAMGAADSDTFADPFSAAPRPLGKNTSVRFELGDSAEQHNNDYVECRTTTDHRGTKVLRVHGGDRFNIRPSSTNVCEIEVVHL